GTAPSVSASEGFDILIRVSDGRGGVVEQSYVLLVVDTTPTSDKGKVPKKSGRIRIIPTSDFEENKYFDQFNPRRIVLLDEDDIKETKIFESKTFLTWLLILSILIAIAIIVIVFVKYK
ncbi:MAG: hypothetical protein QXD63_02390, partial [Candidatus Pacearchaeota archaeon]